MQTNKPKQIERTLHLLYCPFVGLGLYGGWRGNRWLKNRIKIFKQFVVPSLLAQTNKDFVLWVSWIPEMRNNKLVQGLVAFLDTTGLKVAHTYAGVCFYDDKYPDAEAKDRLALSLHYSASDLSAHLGECELVLMTIQPSDDCYRSDMVERVQKVFVENKDVQAFGYRKGLIMRYATGEVAEYNPLTIPPFFTIKFKHPVFIDPYLHMQYTGPYKSHEYIAERLKFLESYDRGFLVGTHGENISTVFDHPFKGADLNQSVLKDFGLEGVDKLQIEVSLRKRLLRKLPHRVQRKIRYLFGEKIWNKIYNFLRA